MLWFFGELFAVTPPDTDIFQLRDLRAAIEDGSWVITDDASVSLTTRHVAWQQFPCCFHISLYLCFYIFGTLSLFCSLPHRMKALHPLSYQAGVADPRGNFREAGCFAAASASWLGSFVGNP